MSNVSMAEFNHLKATVTKLQKLIEKKGMLSGGSYSTNLTGEIDSRADGISAAAVSADITTKSLTTSAATGTGDITCGHDLSVANNAAITGNNTVTGTHKAGAYQSSDGTAGATEDVSISGTTLSFKDGIFTGSS